MLKKEERDKILRNDEIIAFLGKGTEFKGVITYEGTIRIDGRVEGEIVTKGTLIVGETALIDAEVTAGTVVSGGRITGNVRAYDKVHLLSTAVQNGLITAPSLVVEEGVLFNGKCEMERDGVPMREEVGTGMTAGL
jgi:cytoskeletal protein CcmA (bactofilin family)